MHSWIQSFKFFVPEIVLIYLICKTLGSSLLDIDSGLADVFISIHLSKLVLEFALLINLLTLIFTLKLSSTSSVSIWSF